MNDDRVDLVAARLYQPSEPAEEALRRFKYAPDYVREDWRRRARVAMEECFKWRPNGYFCPDRRDGYELIITRGHDGGFVHMYIPLPEPPKDAT